MLKCSKYVVTYYRARDRLPEEGIQVNVAPNDAESAFVAVRYGKKWEIIHRRNNKLGAFYSHIHRNDWWAYLEK